MRYSGRGRGRKRREERERMGYRAKHFVEDDGGRGGGQDGEFDVDAGCHPYVVVRRRATLRGE